MSHSCAPVIGSARRRIPRWWRTCSRSASPRRRPAPSSSWPRRWAAPATPRSPRSTCSQGSRGAESPSRPAPNFPTSWTSSREGALVIALSQSGETIDVIDAMRAARRQGARIAALVNVEGSTLWRLADLTAAPADRDRPGAPRQRAHPGRADGRARRRERGQGSGGPDIPHGGQNLPDDTHNLRAVADADLILLLNESRIVGQGRHDELPCPKPALPAALRTARR